MNLVSAKPLVPEPSCNVMKLRNWFNFSWTAGQFIQRYTNL